MRIAIVACLILAMPGIADDKIENEKELKKFQGSWTYERVETEGKETPLNVFKTSTVVYDGEKWYFKSGKNVLQTGTHKFDISKSPKTFDVKITEGISEGITMLGIYEFDGDTLKVCFDYEGKKRPTEFKTAAGSKTRLVIHKLVK